MTNEIREEEVWKTYPDYPFIEASNLGRIRTKDRVIVCKDGKKRHIKGRMLKQNFQKGGYLYVSFGVDGKKVTLLVHRVFAISFLPNPDNLPEVNHIDCDRANNRLDNLEWCTREYNNIYREKYGRACNHSVSAMNLETLKVLHFESQHEAARKLDFSHSSINDALKGRHGQTHGYLIFEDESKINKEKIQEIKANIHFFGGVFAINLGTLKILYFHSQAEASRQLGVNQAHVNNVIKGKRNRTGDYWFCYADEDAVEKTRSKFGDKVAEKIKKLMKDMKTI